MFIWARKKHGRPSWRTVNAKYRHNDPKGRVNFVTHLQDGSPIWLYRMSDRLIRRYWVNWQRPTYEDAPVSLIDPISYPAKESDQTRLLALQRDKHTCQLCQQTEIQLQVHHIIPKEQGGTER
jgi:5-methylcytosine-specific restriction endonuclease McrA